MKTMDEQQKKNRRVVMLIAAMSVLPLLLAWVVRLNPQWLGGTTNHGQLLVPPLLTERAELQGFDAFSRDNLGELQGHWVMLHVLTGGQCATECAEALHKTKQLWLMMNKDLTRIRRAVVLLSPVDATQAANWWRDDDRLLRTLPGDAMRQKLLDAAGGQLHDGMLLLMDPLGNLMMRYSPGFDPYDVREDLKKLLQVSQIG